MLADAVTKENIMKWLNVNENLILEITGNFYSVHDSDTSSQLTLANQTPHKLSDIADSLATNIKKFIENKYSKGINYLIFRYLGHAIAK